MNGDHLHVVSGCICRHCHEGMSRVLQIIHHHDGFLEFSCGAEHPDEDDFAGLCNDCNHARLQELSLLFQLQPGEWARRSAQSDQWEMYLLPLEEALSE